MEINERKLKILQAIISDFIKTAEPVGSRTLSKNYNLGVSAATIRNEMADLEDMGYLTHPHTSAGRVPSEKAYRLYVNKIMTKPELSRQKKKEISARLKANLNELDRTIEYAAKLLSEITNLTSFAMAPSPEEERLNFIKVLPVDEYTVVLMIVSDNGKVTNTTLRLHAPYDDEVLNILSKSMTYNYKGKTLSEALTMDIIRDFESDVEAMSGLVRNIMPNFLKTLEDMLNVELYFEGLTNIFSIPEYNDMDRAKMFMEMIDKKEDFTKVLISRDDGLLITIGEENQDEVMKDCSLVTATYHIDGQMVGKLGVVGPTRMKYAEITSVIEYLSDNISKAFEITGGSDDER